MVPIIYTPAAFWNPSLGGCTAFRDLPLTIGHLGVTCPSTPNAWTAWAFWHYTMHGSVAGITTGGNVFLLHFNGTETQLRTLLK